MPTLNQSCKLWACGRRRRHRPRRGGARVLGVGAAVLASSAEAIASPPPNSAPPPESGVQGEDERGLTLAEDSGDAASAVAAPRQQR